MSSGSPTAYLLWAILSCIFLAFLFYHLWAYDKFNCIKWGAGRQPGAFKRVMTYSYLATLPLLVVFSVLMTTVKYMEGYVLISPTQIVPQPFALWNPRNRRWVLPLYFVLSIAWSFELVTHLEELTFWVFLLHQSPSKRDWFHSWEFRVWYLGSIIAVLGMPLTTLLARRQLETCLARIFLVGSSAGTLTTLCFLYVLARYPRFIRHVKLEGAEPDVVVRLATSFQLNRIRVMFRFVFTIPLFIIAVDGIQGPYPIVSNPFAIDFLLMLGGIGCFISSAITLLIFFPRSVTREFGYETKVLPPGDPGSTRTTLNHIYRDSRVDMHISTSHNDLELDLEQPHVGTSLNTDMGSIDLGSHPASRASVSGTVQESPSQSEVALRHIQDPGTASGHRDMRSSSVPHRRRPNFTAKPPTQEEGAGRDLPVPSQLHPYVINFLSPIDLVEISAGPTTHIT